MKLFKDYYLAQLQLEMAHGEENVSKLPKLYDEKDLEYLHNFPIKFWPQALRWRYGKGLFGAAEAREAGTPVSDNQEVHLTDHGNTYIFHVNTGINNLLGDLERPIDQGGKVDWDASKPQKYRNEEGEVVDSPDAPHSFASFYVMKDDVISRRTLRIWMAANQAGILGEPPKEFNGQPTSVEKIGEFNLPAIKKTINYTLIDKKGQKSNKSENVVLPVLNSGSMALPMGSHRKQFKDIFDLGGKQGDGRLKSMYISDIPDLEGTLSKLGLAETRKQQVREWIQANPGETLDKLLAFLDFKHYPRDEDQIVNRLKHFEHLTPQQQARMKTLVNPIGHTGDDPIVLGGWTAQRNIPKSTPLKGFSKEQQEKIAASWRPRFMQAARKGKLDFIKTLPNSNGAMAAILAANDMIEDAIADLMSQNLGDPNIGISDNLDPNSDDQKRDNARVVYAKSKTRTFAQLDLGGGLGTRRNRNKVQSWESKGGKSDDFSSLGDTQSSSGTVDKQGDLKIVGRGKRKYFQTVGSEVSIGTWLSVQRGEKLAQTTRKQLEKTSNDIKKTFEDLYNQHLIQQQDDLAAKNIPDDEKNLDLSAAADFATQHLASELSKRGIHYSKDLLNLSAITANTKDDGTSTIQAGDSDDSEGDEALKQLLSTGSAEFNIGHGHIQDISLDTLKSFGSDALAAFAKIIQKGAPNTFNKIWPQVLEKIGRGMPKAEPSEVAPAPAPTTVAAPVEQTPVQKSFAAIAHIHSKMHDPETINRLKTNPETMFKVRNAAHKVITTETDPKKVKWAQQILADLEQAIK